MQETTDPLASVASRTTPPTSAHPCTPPRIPTLARTTSTTSTPTLPTPYGTIRDRLRPTKRVRQVHGTAVSACYAGTLATFAWLLGEAFLHLNALIMLISVALLTWLVPDAHRVWRWLRTGRANGEAVPMSWSVQLVVTAITALNLFLLIYAHL